jgi:hypothetical protein
MTGHLPDHAGEAQPETPYDYIPRSSRDVPELLRPVLDRSFALNREQRWADIHEFATEFRAAFAKAYAEPNPVNPS